jgi:hypothetical protein
MFKRNSFLFLEEKEMNTFLLNKTQYYIDRPDEYLALFKYITGDHKDFTLVKEPDKANDQPLMVLSSQSGDGKTMLLAKFVLDIEVKSLTKYINCFEIDITIGKNERQSYYLLLFC